MRARQLLIGMLLFSACTSTPTATPPSQSPSPTPTPSPSASSTPVRSPGFREFKVASGSHPHDVAPADDGRVWFTEQNAAALGVLDPKTGKTRDVKLGAGSRPRGVIMGPDDAPWVTDQGLNAIVRVDPKTYKVRVFKISTPNVGPHTPTFDNAGRLWFTGSAGYYGSVDIETGEMTLHNAPQGSGPYGIDTAPDGRVWFANLSKSYIARVNISGGTATAFNVPTDGGGARRIWSDSKGILWVTEWFSGKLARYDPRANKWSEWKLPGKNPQPYAIYVDQKDIVWITDFGSNSLVRFDPGTKVFKAFVFPTGTAEVRQLYGRPGEIWGAESGTDKLVVLRT